MTIAGRSQKKGRKTETAPPEAAASARRRPWLKRGLWTAFVVAVLFVAYLLAGYYAVPRLIRHAANSWAQDTLKKPIRIGDIRFDPLRFTLDVQDLAIPEDKAPMLMAERIHVGFSILSLPWGPYRFTEVRLERPMVRAVIRPDHSLNLTDLLPKPKAPSKPGRAVRIGTFAVSRGELIFADQSLPDRPQTTLIPVAFTLKDFQTDSAAGGAFTLKARSELGEGFAWSGSLSAAPIHSRGRIQISALRAQTIGAFLGPSAPARFDGGLMDFTTGYDLRYGEGDLGLDLAGASLDVAGLKAKGGLLPAGASASVEGVQARLDRLHVAAGARRALDIQAALPSVTMDGLGLAAPGQPVRIKAIALTGVRFDAAARRLQADVLTLDGADLRVRRGAGGRLSLASLMTPGRPATTSGRALAPVAQPAPWSLHLGSFALRGARLELDDQATSPALHTLVTPIDLIATDLDSDLSKPVALRFDARMDGARVEATGSATPASAAGDFKVALSGLPLKTLLPYGPPLHDVDLTSGDLSASGELRFKGADAKALRFDGQAAIDKVSVRQPSTNGLLFSWDAFRLEGLRYASGRATVREGALTTPVGRVIIMPDRTLNLAAMTSSAAPATPPAATTPLALPQKAAVAPASGPPPPATLFTMQRLTISGGTMEFADLSIQPNFQARIEALQGSLSNLSNAPDAIAGIDLSGQVIDRFSPATIKGSMDLFGFDRQTDLHMAFRNIELPLFNPYSGRYAGYAIAKGKLTTELSYRIDHRKLVADHHVIIDQLQWGQATDSKDKAPFPIRLATALLKDKNGVIDLDVPVTGSLDDPKFRLWPIIWQVVRTTLEKAAVAPFRLIGSLFAGAEKAQYVDFEPGSTALSPEASQSLGALAGALAQKKELSLDIPAGPGLDADATALADARIDAALITQKKGAPASLAALPLDEQLKRMKALYKAQFHKDPAFPQPQAPATAKTSPDLRKTGELQWMREQLRPVFAPSRTDLAELGAARAKAVRDALLARGDIDPTRVFMTPQAAASLAEGHPRLELKLQ
ncbi:MAG TPA: DUF748 domain-containing protein [Caulobacteraceae bacterium]|jgi:uncharacterized protein involved in outer membrane biogenesis|nr:DUF748 domain-containing protein [Caulobacteraceae bacterium]